MNKVIWLELNEINFDYVRKYISEGHLPNFSRALKKYGYTQTTSETVYENIEPWIQWVTAHTGLDYTDHGLFRLGDVRNSDVTQIWEYLESRYGKTVAAVSPMNAANRTQRSPFFIPDPWTGGRVSGPPAMSRLYESISNVVNENAQGRVGLKDAGRLLTGLVRYGRLGSFPTLVRLALTSRSGKWRQAMFLDRFLTDLFISNWRKHRPDYSSLFLNAGAHIQHHYMFNSKAYPGPAENPQWYAASDADPLLEVYELYDTILGEVLALPDTRVMVLTGLHQDPYDETAYYYRLANHESFLRRIGVEYSEVLPRMSRDFLVRCESEVAARNAEAILKSCRSEGGEPVFYVENKGTELFCMLTYPSPIDKNFKLLAGDRVFDRFHDDVAFVAIKNGKHNGVGYFIDTAKHVDPGSESIPLGNVYNLTINAIAAPAQSDAA
jgi:hypothetical protein